MPKSGDSMPKSGDGEIDLERIANEGPVEGLRNSLRKGSEGDASEGGWRDEFVASGPKPCPDKPID